MKTPLQKQTGSPYWYADLRVWNAAKGKMVRRLVSTKTTVEADAQVIADEMAGATVTVNRAVKGAARLSRSDVVHLLNDLLVTAGVKGSVTLESWRSFAARWLRVRSARVSEDTMNVYGDHCADWEVFLGTGVDAPMADVTPGMVQDWYEKLTREHSPETVRVRLHLIRGIFKRARAEGVIESSPFDLLEKKKLSRQAREPFTIEEIGRMVEVCRSKGWREKETVIWLGLCTGARFGDCARMGTDHLDSREWVLCWTDEKTRKRMQVPVVEPLKSHLVNLMAKRWEGPFCPTLAVMRDSGRSNAFRYLLDLAGVGMDVRAASPSRKMKMRSFHHLRHTLTSWMAEAGVEASTRRAIVGHSTAAVHEKYTHVTALAVKRGAVEAGLASFIAVDAPEG